MLLASPCLRKLAYKVRSWFTWQNGARGVACGGFGSQMPCDTCIYNDKVIIRAHHDIRLWGAMRHVEFCFDRCIHGARASGHMGNKQPPFPAAWCQPFQAASNLCPWFGAETTSPSTVRPTLSPKPSITLIIEAFLQYLQIHKIFSLYLSTYYSRSAQLPSICKTVISNNEALQVWILKTSTRTNFTFKQIAR